jgi:hypothetical protein
MSDQTIDLGDGHRLTFHRWAPDRALNPQYDDLPDVERYGATIEHRHHVTGVQHTGGVTFDGPVQRAHAGRPEAINRALWQVESWDPLTLSPSVLCDCGDHGYVRNGRWIAV